MEIFILLIIAGVVIYAIKKSASNKRTSNPPSEYTTRDLEDAEVIIEDLDDGAGVEIRLSSSNKTSSGPLFKDKSKELSSGFRIREPVARKDNKKQLKGTEAKWISPNEKIKIRGLDIEGGMIYFGDNLSSENKYGYGETQDACLINPKLKTLPSNPWLGGEEMGYWPHYGDLSPKCRGAYLQWLATGRSEPEANIGYVFLFFYGLERRLLIDGQKGLVSPMEKNVIALELRRLISIYGENSSFKGYASRLLVIEWILRGDWRKIPEYMDFDQRSGEQLLQFVLAGHVAEGKPISADIAFQWIKVYPEYKLRTPAKRCSKEFELLFFKRYEGLYGDGLVIKPNKTPLRIEYYPASSSIPRDMKLKTPNLPNPYILSGPIKKLVALADDCVSDLDAYSRFLGRKGNEPGSLAAMALLPKELFAENPEISKIKSALKELCLNRRGHIKAVDLYRLLNESPPMKINKKEAEALCGFLESLEYGLAPDVRHHGVKPLIDGFVTVFLKGHGVDFRPSKEFFIMGTILRMGAMVSQIDNDISPAEEQILQELIGDNRELTIIEKDSLQAYLYWMLRTPQSFAGLKQRLSEVSETEREAISKILISVAHADGKIEPSEVKQLEKLYTALGLDKSSVLSDLHSIPVDSGPVTVGMRDLEVSYSIPRSESTDSKVKSFQLNEQLIRIREEETRQVKGVLESIFTEQSDEKEEETFVEPPVESSDGEACLAKLDDPHKKLFDKIRRRESWDREAFQNICKDLDLMTDGAMEVLNEWAYDLTDSPLIEDGEAIYVDIDLAKEIING